MKFICQKSVKVRTNSRRISNDSLVILFPQDVRRSRRYFCPGESMLLCQWGHAHTRGDMADMFDRMIWHSRPDDILKCFSFSSLSGLERNHGQSFTGDMISDISARFGILFVTLLPECWWRQWLCKLVCNRPRRRSWMEDGLKWKLLEIPKSRGLR